MCKIDVSCIAGCKKSPDFFQGNPESRNPKTLSPRLNLQIACYVSASVLKDEHACALPMRLMGAHLRTCISLKYSSGNV